VKRSAVFAAKSIFEGKSPKHKIRPLISLAIILTVCGVFYSLFDAHNSSAQTKDNDAKRSLADPVCEQDLPQATLANPNFEIYKLEELCKKPQKVDIQELKPPRDPEKIAFQLELEEVLSDTPMEAMIDPISEQNRTVAAFLVGIAFKESKFGVYSPSKNGRDCFNYWGYKGKENPVAGGYSCFASPEQAVKKVGARLEKFAVEQNRNTPAKMIIWKCGSSCETHSPQSVAKWISDVSIHFYPLAKPQNVDNLLTTAKISL